MYSIVLAANALALALSLSGCSHEAATGAENKDVEVIFTGDVLLDRGVAAQMQRHGYDWPWHTVDSLLHTADAVVVNLECPVTDRWEPVNKQYIFRGSPAALPAMRRAGVTHATLANNHTMDHGHGGLKDTDSLLRANGITPLGYGRRPQAERLVLNGGCGRKGARNTSIFIISALMMPVENWAFAREYADVCCTSTDSLVAAVESFKSANPSSRLVLCLHWGAEYQTHCTPRQMMDAHRLIDAGADAIVGHHPHVLQNHETYHGRPIYYSLGNFVFDNSNPATHHTCALRLTFTASDSIIATPHYMVMNPSGREAVTAPAR